ncbi:MAG: MFS transporter [Propionibacteriaceae bacterium]|jgi:MFS family permease|nr:MFS transporter [Propionibacteriaceae bacterium]
MGNPLVATARGLKGNPRACVYTEPLWGLSMNLCLPYASVYMLALGVRDVQIGFITTIGMLSQVVFGLLGGILTDKLGRRKTTAMFDILAWCVPSLIWFAASFGDPTWAFWAFLGASVVNGSLQVTQNSWDCLMVEDADREQITGIYSLVIVAGQMSAIFAPIAAVLVAQYSLVPAVRVLYLNAFIVMAIKVVWLYLWSHETVTGVERMAKTQGQSVFRLLLGYGAVVRLALRSPGTVFSLVIAILVAAVGMINNTFWQVIVSLRLHVPDPLLPIFAMGRSILAMVFLFTIVPRMVKSTKATDLRRSLLLGFMIYAAGQSLLALIAPPSGGADVTTYVLLCVSLLCDGFGVGILAMLAESLVALHVDQQERSRVMAIQRTTIMLVVAPFGWIGGLLSSVSRNLPFMLTAAILVVGVIVTLAYYRRDRLDTALVEAHA